jgi:dTDP-4-dehydrorhamnose reductase
MRIIVTGANGQLGQALQAAHYALQDNPARKELAAEKLIGVDLPQCDITNPQQAAGLAALEPDVIIHCAAMTDVDGCARNPDQAFKVNAFGTQNVALACQRAGAAMVYVSTNEVFDGTASRPYLEFDATHPINPYGASKLAGEMIASRLLHELYIVRISWLFAVGGANFVTKILTRADQYERDALRVVADEVANPTYAPDVAAAIFRLIETRHYGTYHLVNEGYCSRHDYAVEILKQAGKQHIPVHPITSDEFQRASRPPAFAPLRNTVGAALDIQLRPWQEALADYFTSPPYPLSILMERG